MVLYVQKQSGRPIKKSEDANTVWITMAIEYLAKGPKAYTGIKTLTSENGL